MRKVYYNFCYQLHVLLKSFIHRRFKVSSQLLALIGKFDAEVGERYRLLEQLTAEFEADRRTKEELEEEMAKQFEIYNCCLEERERAILAEFQGRYDKFVRTRAAKVIQRWWRPIFRRIKLKMKKKKKSKKVRIFGKAIAFLVCVSYRMQLIIFSVKDKVTASY